MIVPNAAVGPKPLASERVYLRLNADEIEFALAEYQRRGLSSSSAFFRLLIEEEMARVGVTR